MRSRSLILAAAVAALALPADAQDAVIRAIDPARSHASFSVTHLYLARVTGTVPIMSGSVTLAPNSTVPTAVEATLDPNHIASGNPDRDDDLQGPDWFDTKRFAHWTFRSSAVTPKANGAFTVAGTLTVHGVAQPVNLDATVVRGEPHLAYHAVGHVDRHAFNMRVTPTDGLIGSDITITLDVEVHENPPPQARE
jgi:polyisoprenoid-binding protein YceI